MSNRQYIGARYIPDFKGLYDETTQYEGLDVVDNGSGTSYIARKTVPAGTPLTNTDYWFIYGASSGAILDLQTRMNEAESDIDTLNNDIKEAYSLFRNKRVVVYGDSTAALDNSYINQLRTSGICSQLVNRAVSGTLMNVGENNGTSLINSSSDLASYDIIVLCYGTNEWQASRTPAQLRGDVDSIINAIRTKNSLISILFVTPPYSYKNFGNSEPNINDCGLYLGDVNAVIVNRCQEYSIPSVDFYTLSSCNKFNYTAKLDPSISDPSVYVHPNTNFATELMNILTKGAKNSDNTYYETPMIKSYDFFAEQTQIPSSVISDRYQTDVILKVTGGTTAYSTNKTVRNIYRYRAKGRCDNAFTFTLGSFTKQVDAGYFDFTFTLGTTIAPIVLQSVADCYITNFQVYVCNLKYPVDPQNITDGHGRSKLLTLASGITPGGIAPQYVYGDNSIDFPYGTLTANTTISAGSAIATFDDKFPKALTTGGLLAYSTNAQAYPLYIVNGELITLKELEQNRVLYICGTLPVQFNSKTFF